jgi:2-polyprenyl-3-methyl-5-hydroxy-6-metoxy-1,4-benzoquinol methylase
MTAEHFDDPVAAYDRLAAHYADLSAKHEPYLRSVENVVISRITRGSQSLLDVGAGDGSRALRLTAESGIKRVVLIEPSTEMVGSSADHAEAWPIRAEDLNAESISERFDIITCLWNVLGHIPTAERRQRALSAISGLLSRKGKFFLDVNHRYHLRSYGVLPTSTRWIHDLFHRNERNGDVITKWSVGDTSISTYGHVFTHREIMRLAHATGLELEERIVIDYQDGRLRRWSIQGNLLYIFRHSSRMDSSSAPQTS